MAQQTTAKLRIESTLTNAIQDSGIRAISLYGPWGTGKTHVVTEFFKKKGTMALLKSHQCQFAYVSFFGLTSILEARQQLCLAALSDPSKRVLSIFKKAGKALPTEVVFGGMSLDLSKLGSLGTNYIEDQALRDLVICIDDLERVPDSFKAREILGFISELTERRGCKCIVVHNRDRLTPDQRAVMDEQHEKIFDLTIEFKPSPSENAAVGICDLGWRAIGTPVFATFQNANIRIMKRFEWALRIIASEFPGTAQDIWPEIVRHTAILVIIKHAHSDVIRDLATVYMPKGMSAAVAKALTGSPAKRGEVPDPIRGYLDDLNYEIAAYDPEIGTLLNTGHLDKESFGAHVIEEKDKAKRLQTEEELGALWDDIRSRFVLEPKKYISRIKAFLKKRTHLRSVDYLDICNMLLELEPNEVNKRLVAKKIGSAIQGIPSNRRPDVIKRFPALLSSKVLELVPEAKSADGPKIQEVLKALAGSESSWDPQQFQNLAMFTDDEIYRALVSGRGDQFVFHLRRLMDRVQATPVENANTLKSRLETIAERIRSLNAVTRFQVDLYIRPVKGSSWGAL